MISPSKALEAEVEAAPVTSKRLFIGELDRPGSALVWGTPGERAKALQSWRTAIGRSFPEAARVLRVAWALEWLFGRDGFAFATDSYLERELLIPIKKIQAALQELERAGAIIRASVVIRGRAQRRIWPSLQIVQAIFPTMGNMHTPHNGPKPFPTVGGQNTLRRETASRSQKFSTTLDEARKAAELRERRDRERSQGP